MARLLSFFNTITWNLSKSDNEDLLLLTAIFLAASVAAHCASTSAAAHFLATVPVLEPLGNLGMTIGVNTTLASAMDCLAIEGPSIKTWMLV